MKLKPSVNLIIKTKLHTDDGVQEGAEEKQVPHYTCEPGKVPDIRAKPLSSCAPLPYHNVLKYILVLVNLVNETIDAFL